MKKLSINRNYKLIYSIIAVISIILIGCTLLVYGISMIPDNDKMASQMKNVMKEISKIPKGKTLFSFICCAKLGKVLTGKC